MSKQEYIFKAKQWLRTERSPLSRPHKNGNPALIKQTLAQVANISSSMYFKMDQYITGKVLNAPC